MNPEDKPVSEFNRLEHCLKAEGTPFKTSEQQKIPGSDGKAEPFTFVLQTGVIAIHRQSDELLLGIARAPFILGLTAGMMGSQQTYTMIAHTDCSGFYLPAATTRNLIHQHELWREAFCWLSWIHRQMEKRDRELVGNNSYSQIRALLMNMATWDEALRKKIGVMNHIQRSTRISRSVIAEVLAALRQGEYIQMSRGKLISINRLPTDY
ncbi:helix-turn-helix domain-containing protein [Pseudenterobacter timonensis]|uniref:Inhibitor of hydrogen peroxide resistance n=1 Tax=Pseudenterobacter timonensis TaxID=1755099 RepID=A0AAE4DNN2_9ENTR|nr:helix-turn-helix domain-containing protein [Pseudenterobacter timonensis]MDR9891013.1 helix-turn-helix domain-containing protein [Pseudenterobacter timonensis]